MVAYLENDMVAYLEYEARRRNITVEEAHKDEMAAQERARAKAFSPKELMVLARKSKPDPRYFDADDDPF